MTSEEWWTQMGEHLIEVALDLDFYPKQRALRVATDALKSLFPHPVRWVDSLSDEEIVQYVRRADLAARSLN